MRHFRTLLMTGAAVALLGASLSAPASAANTGKLAFVQGQPGVRVDICVGNKEIVSGLAYGKYAKRVVSSGNKLFRFAKAAPGACTGKKIVAWTRSVTVGSDTTVALTKFAPRLVVYPDNLTSTPVPPAGSARVIMRHAADIGTAGFRYTIDEGTPWFPEPTADSPWEKGVWGWGTRVDGLRMIWWAHVPPNQTAIAGPLELVVEGDTRHEIVLVGTTLANVKLVRIDTPL